MAWQVSCNCGRLLQGVPPIICECGRITEDPVDDRAWLDQARDEIGPHTTTPADGSAW